MKSLTFFSFFAFLFAVPAQGSIMVDFLIPSGFTGGDRLNLTSEIVLDFSIDGTGMVTLDASNAGAAGSSSTVADSQAAVNSWDGVVGTVIESSLFNTDFTLTMNGFRRDDAMTTFNPVNISGDGAIDGTTNGVLGIFGQNASRIDGSNLTNVNLERIAFTLSTTTSNLVLDFESFSHFGGGGSDAQVIQNTTTVDFFNIGDGTADLSASSFELQNGESIIFTMPESGNAGFGLDAITFSAVPEPSTIILLSLGALLVGGCRLRAWRTREKQVVSP
ncbi:MAG: PEP-CTERM sorting domain-containing protein [Verrucomicrobiota bacterium]